jgi:hypothetical protein
VFSPDQLDMLMKEAMAELGKHDLKNQGKIGRKSNLVGVNGRLTTAQALVILGILSGSLSVFSVLVDADQVVSIVLQGSLKKEEKNEVDNILAQIGHLPFDDVVKAMMKRIK